jgi:hypothetical protein
VPDVLDESLPTVRDASPTADPVADLRQWLRRDAWIQVLLLLPLLFAFDQGLRGAMMAGWVPANVWTLLVLRPALDFLGGRALSRWLLAGRRKPDLLIVSVAAIDGRSFGQPVALCATAFGAWFVGLLVVEVLLEMRGQKSLARR